MRGTANGRRVRFCILRWKWTYQVPAYPVEVVPGEVREVRHSGGQRKKADEP